MLPDLDLERIADPDARAVIVRMLNVVETLTVEVRLLREENQRLRDENNRLKGEHGKPEVLPRVPPKARAANHSSEQERRESREHRKGVKRARLTITREQVLRLDRRMVPRDAVRK
ncbi:MAG: IS66 family transposase, partial [Chloroflexota bacterium]